MTDTRTPRVRYPLSRVLGAYFSRLDRAWLLVPANVVLMVAITVFQAVSPRISGWLIDALRTDPVHFARSIAGPGIAVLCAVTVLYFLVELAQKTVQSWICLSVRAGFQRDLYRHLLRLSEDFYQRTKVGEIATRMTKDMDSGIGPFYQTICQAIWAFGLMLVASTVLAGIHWSFGALFLSVSTAWAFVGRFYFERMFTRQRDLSDQYGTLSSRMTEGMASQELVRAFTAERRREDELRRDISDYLAKSLSISRINTTVWAGTEAFLMYFAPLVALTLAIGDGGTRFTVGEIVAVYGTWAFAAGPLLNLIFVTRGLVSSRASIDRVLEFFDETPLVRDAPGAPRLRISRGAIGLSNVGFAYPLRAERRVLDCLTIDVRPGARTAIVGPSGSGKSTIVSLLLRLYDPQSGTVLIDDQDLRSVAQQSVREQIGLVMQDTILLSGSIRDNLRFIRPLATDSQMEQALRNAGLWEFVQGTGKGIDTVVGEKGVGLSGGQRQRLGIARVFLQDPPIVVFDEATSALDSVTERGIQDAMKSLFRGRTSIVIAHRLSTILECDAIVVLIDGMVVATGTHEELVHKCELYRRMCQEQRIALKQ